MSQDHGTSLLAGTRQLRLPQSPHEFCIVRGGPRMIGGDEVQEIPDWPIFHVPADTGFRRLRPVDDTQVYNIGLIWLYFRYSYIL
ncbi:MAG: hypothetical protein H6889_15770 [Brucellaceae bacterium]|nr:hypothetical protein [Notoacmeibacter sp.]MCC0028408.1 hypothetical protein [Brucellaceae bacterium]